MAGAVLAVALLVDLSTGTNNRAGRAWDDAFRPGRDSDETRPAQHTDRPGRPGRPTDGRREPRSARGGAKLARIGHITVSGGVDSEGMARKNTSQDKLPLSAVADEWRIDASTREIGRRGLAEARAALAEAARRSTRDQLGPPRGHNGNTGRATAA